MNLHSLLGSVAESLKGAVSSIRKQAPGAKMIGEMTVKYVSRDVARRLGHRDGDGPRRGSS